MNSPIKMISSLLSIIRLRFKIILRDKLTIFLILFSIILFNFLLGTLSLEAVEKSRIPIGIVDKDKSELSRELIKNLKNNRTISVLEDNFDNLNHLLKHERIESIYVIKNGYEVDIKKGKNKGVIDVYNMVGKKDNEILSDIVAGDFIYPVTLWKSIHKYLDYTKMDINTAIKEYLNYADTINRIKGNHFKFDIEYKQIKNPEFMKELKNEVIYYQIIFAFLGILISLIQMFFSANILLEKDNGIIQRLNIQLSFRRLFYIGNYITILGFNVILSIIFALIFHFTVKIESFKNIFLLFQFIFLYSSVIGGIFLIFTKKIKGFLSYQLVGAGFVLLNGICGFVVLLGNVVFKQLLNILKIVPNSLFIQDFTDIIINGKGQGIHLFSNPALSIYICFIIIILLIPFPFERIGKRTKG